MPDPTFAQLLDLQRAQAGIGVVAERSLGVVLGQLFGQDTDPWRIRDATIRAAQITVGEYGRSAGVMAADWYARTRREVGVGSAFTAAVFVPDASMSVAGTVRRVIGPLFEGATDMSGVIDTITAAAARYVADSSRETVRRNAVNDPRASGWRRVAVGETCDFCLILVGRGGVYKESTVRFKSHRRCNCAAAPSWDANAVEVPEIAYAASASDSASAGVQDWIDSHQVELDELRSSLAV